MATISEVNAAYLAVLGRPAEGSAYTWASNFDSVTATAQAILEAQKQANADFVTELYSSLLNRTADASGKAYWTGLLDAGESKESVEKQFIAAIIAQGETDPYNVDFVSLKTSSFVSDLYKYILSKAGDAEGVAYWGDRLAAGLTRAELANEFIGALEANPTSEDGQLLAAKSAVAEKFTNTFDHFSTLIPAEKQAEALAQIKGDFANITASTSPDDYTTEFDNFKAVYQDIASQGFTRDPNDNLTSDTSTALYVGTVNIADAAQGTIQGTDKAAGFADSKENSITVNVDGYNKDTTNTLDLANMAQLSGIQQMVINNGSAGVSGAVAADVTNLTIAGAAAHEVNITSASATTVNINSAANTEVTFSGTATDAVKYTGAAGNDTVTVTNLDTSDFGAGNDVVEATGTIAKDATISLGNGNDTLKLLTGVAGGNVTIDGGSNTAGGEDTLELSGNQTGITTIKNIEVIKASAPATLTAKVIDGQGIKINATANTLALDASGATSIDLTKLTDGTDGAGAALTISGVEANTTIELNATDAIAETITLAATATGVTITGIAAQDKLDGKLGGINSNAEKITAASVVSSKISAVAKDNAYFVAAADIKMTSITDKAGLLAAIADGAKAISSGSTANILVNDGSKTAIYLVTGGAKTTAADETVDLIATVDNVLSNTAGTIATGVITFA